MRRTGRLTLHLAKEFGFCYGVDRAVDYAYQTRKRFPDRRVFLTGEIIHNRHVNDRLRSQDIRILTDPGEDRRTLGPDDVVILPAFGVSMQELAELDRQGCTLVDTTCGSVLNVWKNVRRYAQEGFTAVIHGKVHHEETRATASQATAYPNGHYLIVRDQGRGADRAAISSGTAATPARSSREFADGRLGRASIPSAHLQRIGCANQTTMLMAESLAIGEMFRRAMADRYGDAGAAGRGFARSTRSAARRRSARMPCWPCSTPSRSTWWS